MTPIKDVDISSPAFKANPYVVLYAHCANQAASSPHHPWGQAARLAGDSLRRRGHRAQG